MKNNYFFLSIAIIISAAILGFCVVLATTPKASVLVRGLAQREVSADLGIWRISYGAGSNSLLDLQKEIKEKNEIIKEYLLSFGLENNDFNVLAATINDTSLDIYSNKENIKFTYLGTVNFIIRTNKIKELNEAYKNAINLASKNIAIKQDFENKITYEFTKLNEIKPEMIEEATISARAAAQKFAKDSGSEVGKIKNATQGLFSIENAAGGLEERKNIRVVTQVEYYLK